ncbi:MAG: creatininase family protein [Thermoleophilaceae bacterium]
MLIGYDLEAIDYRFELLPYPAIAEFIELERERKAALFLPLGALMPHGPHLPTGTDLLFSLRICRDACAALANREVSALTLPPIPIGATTYFNELPGGLGIGRGLMKEVLLDIVTELMRQGIRHLMVVNNNHQPEHVAAIYGAIADAPDPFSLHYMDVTHPARERRAQVPQAYRKNDLHAGRYETSLMLATDPTLVDEEVRRSLPPLPIDLIEKIRTGQTSIDDIGADRAYIGFPADASAAEGEETYANLGRIVLEAVDRMLRGEAMSGPGWHARIADTSSEEM